MTVPILTFLAALALAHTITVVVPQGVLAAQRAEAQR